MNSINKPTSRAEAIQQLTRPGEPFALATRERRGGEERYFVNALPNLRALFETTASDATFIVYQDERTTFAEAWRSAKQLSLALVRDLGVGKGDRVAISMRNYPEWIIIFTAAVSVGAVVVAMNAHWRPDEIAYALADCGAKVLFADRERLDRLAQLERPVAISVIGVRADGHRSATADYASMAAGQADVASPDQPISPDDPAIMLYTSGSTGHPKGVLSTHRNVMSALWSWELDAAAAAMMMAPPPPAPAQQTGTLLAIPLFHVTGLHAVYLTAYRAQQRLVCMYKWDPDKAAELIEQEGVSRFVAPSAVTGDLVRIAQRTGRDLSSLAAIGGGGAPRPAEQVSQIPVAFPHAAPATGWGMTETNDRRR